MKAPAKHIDKFLATCNMQNKHLHPFGMQIEERSWTTPSVDYKYGFNGQEMDNEVADKGNSMTAEFWQFDTRMGRRWNLDPEVYPSKSCYSAYSNCPISLVDPQGNTDFYSMDGKWIGKDDSKNEQISVVTDDKLIQSIKRTSKRGKLYTATLPNDKFYNLPSREVNEATLDVFDAGNDYEAFTAFNCDMKQSPIVIGEDFLGREDMNPEIVLGPDIPEGFDIGAVSIHSHPKNYIEADGGIYSIDATKPTGPPNDETLFKTYDLNIIVGKEGLARHVTKTSLRTGTTQLEHTTVVGERRDVATYFNSQSETLFSIDIGALRDISDGSGKSDSKVYKKFNKKQ